MKTIDEAIETHRDKGTLDGRNLARLAEFLPAARVAELGFEVKDPDDWSPKPWTEAEVLAQLKDDVEFGFEKALNQRGISSSFMHECVEMWNDILGNGIGAEYPHYGLPLFAATARRYGWPCPIGDDTGSEDKYASSW